MARLSLSAMLEKIRLKAAFGKGGGRGGKCSSSAMATTKAWHARQERRSLYYVAPGSRCSGECNVPPSSSHKSSSLQASSLSLLRSVLVRAARHKAPAFSFPALPSLSCPCVFFLPSKTVCQVPSSSPSPKISFLLKVSIIITLAEGNEYQMEFSPLV